jgi:hypothetical protein
MQIWEYRTIAVGYNSGNGLPIVRHGNTDQDLSDHLQELGKQGWELVGVSPGMNDNREFMMFFKRTKGQDRFPNT